MSRQYFDRYQFFVEDGKFRIVPGIEIPIKPSDRYMFYKKGRDRFDKISQDYYGSPVFGWLILQANPQFGGLEWSIPDGTTINVPFPLVATLQDYNAALNNYFFYYGR